MPDEVVAPTPIRRHCRYRARGRCRTRAGSRRASGRRRIGLWRWRYRAQRRAYRGRAFRRPPAPVEVEARLRGRRSERLRVRRHAALSGIRSGSLSDDDGGRRGAEESRLLRPLPVGHPFAAIEHPARPLSRVGVAAGRHITQLLTELRVVDGASKATSVAKLLTTAAMQYVEQHFPNCLGLPCRQFLLRKCPHEPSLQVAGPKAERVEPEPLDHLVDGASFSAPDACDEEPRIAWERPSTQQAVCDVLGRLPRPSLVPAGLGERPVARFPGRRRGEVDSSHRSTVRRWDVPCGAALRAHSGRAAWAAGTPKIPSRSP